MADLMGVGYTINSYQHFCQGSENGGGTVTNYLVLSIVFIFLITYAELGNLPYRLD